MEGVADTAGISSTQGGCDITVGGDITCGDLAHESIDLGEEGHRASLSLMKLTILASIPFLDLVWVPIT